MKLSNCVFCPAVFAIYCRYAKYDLLTIYCCHSLCVPAFCCPPKLIYLGEYIYVAALFSSSCTSVFLVSFCLWKRIIFWSPEVRALSSSQMSFAVESCPHFGLLLILLCGSSLTVQSDIYNSVPMHLFHIRPVDVTDQLTNTVNNASVWF